MARGFHSWPRCLNFSKTKFLKRPHRRDNFSTVDVEVESPVWKSQDSSSCGEKKKHKSAADGCSGPKSPTKCQKTRSWKQLPLSYHPQDFTKSYIDFGWAKGAGNLTRVCHWAFPAALGWQRRYRWAVPTGAHDLDTCHRKTMQFSEHPEQKMKKS